MYPFNLHSNDFSVIFPKNKPFLAETLKAENSGGVINDDSTSQAIMILFC
jgi:hypothetical protein